MTTESQRSRRTLRQRLGQLLVVALAVGVFAAPALAATSNWSWSMHYRYVSGDANGVYYTFGTGGTMTFAGDVWAKSKDGGANPAPSQITNRVYRQGWPSDPLACSALRTPSSTLFEHRSFSTNCGTEPADTYYVVAYTIEDDGWNTEGAGTLKMP